MDANNQQIQLDGRTVKEALELYMREKMFRPGTVLAITSTSPGAFAPDGYQGMNVTCTIQTAK